MTNRVIKASDIRMVKAYARSGSYQWASDGGMNGRVRLYAPNGRGEYVEVELQEVEIEDDAPAYADALHKLAEQSDRNVDLAKRLQREQDRNFELSCTIDAERQARAEHVEQLHQAIEDERATAAALQAELDKARAELADRQTLLGIVHEAQRHLCQATYDLQTARRQYVDPYFRHAPSSGVDASDIRTLKDLIVSPKARRQYRKFRKGK